MRQGHIRTSKAFALLIIKRTMHLLRLSPCKMSMCRVLVVIVGCFTLTACWFLYGHLDVPRLVRENRDRFDMSSFRMNANIERRQLPSDADRNDKWIVLTTINYPTAAVKKFASLPGWKVVVVGDKKTPADWEYPNCVFLSVETQKRLGYRIEKLIPLNHYGRKNIGYLYAVEHGAQVIYESDDDNYLIYNNIDEAFITNNESKAMINYWRSDASTEVNPYAYFGDETLWPRGYPLTKIAKRYAFNSLTLKTMTGCPAVQQGLANGDPDMDAIFRLTRKKHNEPIRVSFQNKTALVLPSCTFSPFNSQNTLFHYSTFWGLMIPITVSFRVCDIWRGYWTQRLMWEVGEQMSFHKPSVFQDRNPHSYLKDFNDELQMYLETEKLIGALLEWNPRSSEFSKKIVELSNDMHKNEFWGKADVELAVAFIEDLRSVGYSMPKSRPKQTRCSDGIRKNNVDAHESFSLSNHPEPFLLVVGILTAEDHVALRNAIRDTYLRDAKQHQDIHVVFVLDTPMEQKTILESQQYNDMVFLPTKPEGRGVKFGEKLFRWLEIVTHIPAYFYAKIDDDVLLCVNTTLNVLHEMQSSEYKSEHKLRAEKEGSIEYLYMGAMHKQMQHNKIDKNNRHDEQFVILGHKLAKTIVSKHWPQSETNFGGTSLGMWIKNITAEGLLNELKVYDAHKLIYHIQIAELYHKIRKADVKIENFCDTHMSFHPIKSDKRYKSMYDKATKQNTTATR